MFRAQIYPKRQNIVHWWYLCIHDKFHFCHKVPIMYIMSPSYYLDKVLQHCRLLWLFFAFLAIPDGSLEVLIVSDWFSKVPGMWVCQNTASLYHNHDKPASRLPSYFFLVSFSIKIPIKTPNCYPHDFNCSTLKIKYIFCHIIDPK